MKIRQILQRMGRMCEPAWYIFRASSFLCLALLVGALLLALGDRTQQQTAWAMFETVEAVLLIGLLGSVLIEDQQSRR